MGEKNPKKKTRLYMIGNAQIDPVGLWQDGFHETDATVPLGASTG